MMQLYAVKAMQPLVTDILAKACSVRQGSNGKGAKNSWNWNTVISLPIGTSLPMNVWYWHVRLGSGVQFRYLWSSAKGEAGAVSLTFLSSAIETYTIRSWILIKLEVVEPARLQAMMHDGRLAGDSAWNSIALRVHFCALFYVLHYQLAVWTSMNNTDE